MFIRRAAVRVACLGASLAAAGTITMLAISAAPAGAACATVGACTTPAISMVPIGTVAPNTPFSSGQQITLVAPKGTFPSTGGQPATIEAEQCSDPGLTASEPPNSNTCDGNTEVVGTANADGSADIPFTIYSLPDFTSLGETSSSAQCDDTNPCTVWVGLDISNFGATNYVTDPFYVTPGDDTGSNPGDGTPEVPLAVLLPLSGIGIAGGIFMISRRRRRRVTI
jgi:hypothetical protein